MKEGTLPTSLELQDVEYQFDLILTCCFVCLQNCTQNSLELIFLKKSLVERTNMHSNKMDPR